MIKNENTETSEINTKLSKSKSTHCLWCTVTRKLLKSNQFIITYHFDLNNKKSEFQVSIVSPP